MAMFPVFILGLFAGIVITYVGFYYVKSIPSNTKFNIQEDTITRLRDDIRAMELVNEDLRNQIDELQSRKRKPKHAAEE